MVFNAVKSRLTQVNLTQPNKSGQPWSVCYSTPATRNPRNFLRDVNFQPKFQQPCVAGHRITAKPINHGNAEVELERSDLTIVDDLRRFGQFNVADDGGQ